MNTTGSSPFGRDRQDVTLPFARIALFQRSACLQILTHFFSYTMVLLDMTVSFCVEYHFSERARADALHM
eukprot:scaffold1564_cov174-Amphora_coffeaeformis.AAC.21